MQFIALKFQSTGVTYLRGSETLLGQLVDLVLDVVAGELEPGGDRPSVGESTLGDTLAWCVHTTHLSFLLCVLEGR